MHRPGLSELEPLVKHAERLPVEGVDGQAYLRLVSVVLLVLTVIFRRLH